MYGKRQRGHHLTSTRNDGWGGGGFQTVGVFFLVFPFLSTTLF